MIIEWFVLIDCVFELCDRVGVFFYEVLVGVQVKVFGYNFMVYVKIDYFCDFDKEGLFVLLDLNQDVVDILGVVKVKVCEYFC